jgi:hypothetical protein
VASKRRSGQVPDINVRHPLQNQKILSRQFQISSAGKLADDQADRSDCSRADEGDAGEKARPVRQRHLSWSVFKTMPVYLSSKIYQQSWNWRLDLSPLKFIKSFAQEPIQRHQRILRRGNPTRLVRKRENPPTHWNDGVHQDPNSRKGCQTSPWPGSSHSSAAPSMMWGHTCSAGSGQGGVCRAPGQPTALRWFSAITSTASSNRGTQRDFSMRK